MSLDESRFGTHTWDGLRLKKDQHHLVPMDLNSWPILPKHSARLFFPFPQLLSCASWPAFGATPHLQAHHGPSGMVAANRVDALDLQGNWLDSAGHSIFVSHWATLRTWDDLALVDCFLWPLKIFEANHSGMRCGSLVSICSVSTIALGCSSRSKYR